MPKTTLTDLTQSDMDFAAFIGRSESRPWVARGERFKPSPAVLSAREYDRITDYNLAFIRGQQIAEQSNERRTAA